MKFSNWKSLRRTTSWVLTLIIFTGAGWARTGEAAGSRLTLWSSAFSEGGSIPDRCSSTKRGKNLSPSLRWSDPPKGTRSFALIAEDPDIPLGFVFCHWVVYNMPAERRELSEGVSDQTKFKDGTVQGKNGYGQNHYLGPAPVWGTHRYIFKLYALDANLRPDAGMNRNELINRMKGHVLDQTQLIGRYTKQ